MTTTLPRQIAYELANIAASRVHATLINLHLAGLKNERLSEFDRAQISEVRSLISNIADKWDRVDFIGHVRWLFKKMRAERGTEPTTRAYVAKVAGFKAQQAAATNLVDVTLHYIKASIVETDECSVSIYPFRGVAFIDPKTGHWCALRTGCVVAQYLGDELTLLSARPVRAKWQPGLATRLPRRLGHLLQQAA